MNAKMLFGLVALASSTLSVVAVGEQRCTLQPVVQQVCAPVPVLTPYGWMMQPRCENLTRMVPVCIEVPDLPQRTPAPMDRLTRPVPRIFAPDPQGGHTNGQFVQLDPALCASNPLLCEFTNWHEQGHVENGPSEAAADCYAARNASVAAVHAALVHFRSQGFLGDPSHGDGLTRERRVRQCFQQRLDQDDARRESSTDDKLQEFRQCLADVRKEAKDCRAGCDDDSNKYTCRKECLADAAKARARCREQYR